MMSQPNLKTMGTWPVFLTAISTILGAILFLRFGYAVAHVGLVSTLLIVFVGHLVTVPTALAVAEIATNQKVEGGGAYYMISRSFGLNIGGAIGLALYLSQAISVAFYVIAFTVACRDLILWADVAHGIHIDPMWVNLGVMGLLTVLMIGKGANLGVKALYLVVVLLFAALVLFFAGSGPGNPDLNPVGTIADTLLAPDGSTIRRFTFFEVFTFIFPAFTGIAAGLGLSGDLKDPRVSIPKGTIWATAVGIVIYIAVAIKLWWSAPLEALATDELYMENIALWGPHHSRGTRGGSDELRLGIHHGGAAHAAGHCDRWHLPGRHERVVEEGPGTGARARAGVLGHMRHCVRVCVDGGHQCRGRDHLHVFHGDLRGHLPCVLPRTHGGRPQLPSHVPLALVHQFDGGSAVHRVDVWDESDLRDG